MRGADAGAARGQFAPHSRLPDGQLEHDREHDRLRTPRDQRSLGHARVRAAQRQSPLPRGRLPPARTSCARPKGELRARLTRQLRRGKVDCTISYRRAAGREQRRSRWTARRSSALLARRARGHALDAASPRPVNALDLLRWPGVLREDGAQRRGAARRRLRRVRRDARGSGRGARARRRAAARAARAALRGTRGAGASACARGCRRCRRACARASTSGWRSWPPASTRSASSRSSRCCCSVSMWMRNSSGSRVTSTRCAA